MKATKINDFTYQKWYSDLNIEQRLLYFQAWVQSDDLGIFNVFDNSSEGLIKYGLIINGHNCKFIPAKLALNFPKLDKAKARHRKIIQKLFDSGIIAGQHTKVIEERNISLVYPFTSEEFLQAWERWKEYKRETHKFRYSSVYTEQAALHDIAKDFKTEKDAIAAIIHAMGRKWKGIYTLKNNTTNEQRNKLDKFVNG